MCATAMSWPAPARAEACILKEPAGWPKISSGAPWTATDSALRAPKFAAATGLTAGCRSRKQKKKVQDRRGHLAKGKSGMAAAEQVRAAAGDSAARCARRWQARRGYEAVGFDRTRIAAGAAARRSSTGTRPRSDHAPLISDEAFAGKEDVEKAKRR